MPNAGYNAVNSGAGVFGNTVNGPAPGTAPLLPGALPAYGNYTALGGPGTTHGTIAGGAGGLGAQGNTGPVGTIFPPSGTAGDAASQGQQLGQQTAGSQLPGYFGDLSAIGANIGAETAGVLPPDVITQIQQQAAERGIATGAPGSDNSNAAMLRALGLTSLNLTQQGQQNFTSILPSLPGYGLSQNPAFYTTPGENLQAGIAGANLTNQKQEFAAEQQAGRDALAQAQAGVKAGLGLGGQGEGGVTLPGARTPGTDAFGFPDGSLTTTPSGAGGGYQTDTPYGAFNPQNPPTPLNQSDVDKILQSYAGGGTAASNIDPETGLPITGGGGDGTDAFDYFYGGDDSSGE